MTFRRTAAAGLIGLWPLAVGLTLLTSKIGQAETAAPAVPQAQVFYSRIEPLTDTMLRAQGDPRPATADGALQLADWLVYSSLATGAAFDNNAQCNADQPDRRLWAAFPTDHHCRKETPVFSGHCSMASAIFATIRS